MKVLLLICATSLVLAQAATDKKVVCYWGSWSVYRESDGAFDLSDVDPKLCTHMIYTFVGLSENGEVKSLDPWCDFADGGGKDNIARMNKLREQNPELKTMVAIGGWKEGETAKYSQVVADPALRQKLVESAVEFVKKHGFDGFDVDWEYPAQRSGSPADKQNFVLLLKELRERFDKEGLILSAAVAAPESSASISYDIPQISKYLDFINIMAYDLYTGYAKTGMNAALHPGSSDSGNEAQLNIDSVIKYWLAEGAPSEKIVLGVPFYGRSFTLADPQSNGIGAPSSQGTAGPYTKEGGMLGYNEICEKLKQENWDVKFDEERRVPYAVNGNQWISFDDEKSIQEKADLIKKHNLGGGMVWSIETDDFRGKCGEKFPLLKTLSSELRNGVSSSKDSPPESVTEQQESQHDQPESQEPQSQTEDDNQQYRPDFSELQESKPCKTKPQENPQENPQEKPQGNPQEPPAIRGQICQAEGYAKDPSNCAKFYYCQYFNNDFISYPYDCPAGTLFDASIGTCNHASLVQC